MSEHDQLSTDLRSVVLGNTVAATATRLNFKQSVELVRHVVIASSKHTHFETLCVAGFMRRRHSSKDWSGRVLLLLEGYGG